MNIKVTKVRLIITLLLVTVVASLVGVNETTNAQVAIESTSINWQTCPEFDQPSGDLECGQLRVPLNYQQPSGTKIDVAVSRLKARKPQLRRGVILLNPGGPSGQGFDMPLWMSELMPQSVLDRYDLIGFDPRGVGRSAPVSCGLTAEQSLQIAPPLMQPGGFDATAVFMKQVADSCKATSGNRLPYMNTANTARDMDMIRQALGESKISYFGYSYGTYLAAVYASLYPNNTDRFVLDSSTNARAAWRELFRSWGQADYVRFPDFAKFLVDNEADYHMGSTQQEVRNTYFQLLHQVEQHPIPLSDGSVINGPWFRVLTFAGLYSDNYFTDTANFWSFVKDQQTGPELQTVVNSLRPQLSFPAVPDDNGGASANAVLCGDSYWSRVPLQYRIELSVDTMLYPMFGELGSNIWPCAFWQNPVESPVPVTSNGPNNKILIVQNQRDPATPYANAQEMRATLGNRARLVTVVQGGHGASYGERNECAKETVTNYFVAGTYPASDSTCPSEENNFAATKSSQAEKNAMRHLHHQMW
jgi:pimeloyl-ACP methyl ester carboxylesterase